MTDFNSSTDAAPDTGEAQATGDFLTDLRGSFVDQVESIDLGEDGSLDMRIRGAEPSEEPAPASETVDAPSAGHPQPETPAVTADPFEARFKDAQSWATKVAQENSSLKERLAKLEGMVEARMGGDVEGGEDDGLDPELSEQFATYLDRNLDKVLASKGIDPKQHQEMAVAHAVSQELRQVMVDHPDFVDYWPVVQEIFQKQPDTNMTYEQAYSLATTLYKIEESPDPESEAETVEAQSQTPVPAGTPAPAAPSPQTPSRADLEQRAREVSTLVSHSTDADITPKRVIKTPFDAAQQALDEMGDL